MNINPSDMDVRQGFSLAQGTVSQQSAETAQTAVEQQTQRTTSDVDARSKAVAAIADKTLAREAAKALNDQLAAGDTGLKIRVLDDKGSTVQVEVVDEQSNKVLRKIPQDDMVKLAATIKEMTGVLLNKPA
jgi:flagellar protein FlaG